MGNKLQEKITPDVVRIQISNLEEKQRAIEEAIRVSELRLARLRAEYNAVIGGISALTLLVNGQPDGGAGNDE